MISAAPTCTGAMRRSGPRLAAPLLALGILLGNLPGAAASAPAAQPAWEPANGGFLWTLAF